LQAVGDPSLELRRKVLVEMGICETSLLWQKMESKPVSEIIQRRKITKED
jgi:hypothetical protein